MAVVGLLAAAWFVAAAIIIWNGLARQKQADKVLQQTSKLGRLLETAPAVPAIIRADGQIEATERFFALLGLERGVATISDLVLQLGRGKVEVSWREFEHNIMLAQKTGKAFAQKLALEGTQRRFLVRGNVADAQIYPNSAALIWLFDLSDTVMDLERLEDEAQSARVAFSALSAVIEAVPMPIWHRGSDYQLNFVNQAYVHAVSAESSDTVNANGVELIEPVNGETAMAFAARAQEAGEPQERILSSTLAGERRQMRVFDIPLGDTGVAGLAIDIQELVDARADFRRLADSQRDLLDKMSSAVAQFGPDHSLNFANLPFQRFFAFRDDWLAARPEFARVLERFRENDKMPEVRDFPLWRAERENWFLSAVPVEENWLLTDGTHLRLLAQPTPDGGLLLIFEDRTEQAQLASARDTLLRVRTATFDNLFEAIAVFTADGKLSIWNRRFAENWSIEETFLAGHPRMDELLAQIAPSLKKAAHISVLREFLQTAISNREMRNCRLATHSGQEFQLSTIPLPDGNVLLTMLDISDSVQIEAALRDRNSALAEADAIKSRFLANMSYEFRTPLTSISGFAELLKAGIAGELSDQAQDYVDAIAKSADRLSQQINTVLDFSQSEAGALPIARKEVDIKRLMQAIQTEFAGLAKDQGAKLVLDVQDSAGTISGDEKRLKQALAQLVDNALRYGKEGGRVLLHASGDSKYALLAISDDGPGMTMRAVETAFDSMDKTGNAGPQNLGLPLTRQLIEAHGGDVRLESELGEGTAVIITLPRTAA